MEQELQSKLIKAIHASRPKNQIIMQLRDELQVLAGANGDYQRRIQDILDCDFNAVVLTILVITCTYLPVLILPVLYCIHIAICIKHFDTVVDIAV